MLHSTDIFGAPHEHIYPRTLYVPKRSKRLKRSSPTRPSLDPSRPTTGDTLDVEDLQSRPPTALGHTSASSSNPEHNVQRRQSRKKRVFTKVLAGLKRTASLRDDLAASGNLNRPISPSLNNTSSTAIARADTERLSSRETSPELLSLQLVPSVSETIQTDIYTSRPPQRGIETAPVDSVPSLPVLNVTLNTIPEAESIALTTEKRMWVAVEIEGRINLPLQNISQLKRHSGLDVIVIIDNS